MRTKAQPATLSTDGGRRTCRSDAPPAWAIEARRREIMDLLEEIRAPEPTSTDVAQVIAQASDGQLQGPRLDRVAAQVIALFKAR